MSLHGESEWLLSKSFIALWLVVDTAWETQSRTLTWNMATTTHRMFILFSALFEARGVTFKGTNRTQFLISGASAQVKNKSGGQRVRSRCDGSFTRFIGGREILSDKEGIGQDGTGGRDISESLKHQCIWKVAIELGEKLEERISQGRRLQIAIIGTTHLPRREPSRGYLPRARGCS